MTVNKKLEQINYILRSWKLTPSQFDYYIGVRDGLEYAQKEE